MIYLLLFINDSSGISPRVRRSRTRGDTFGARPLSCGLCRHPLKWAGPWVAVRRPNAATAMDAVQWQQPTSGLKPAAAYSGGVRRW